jgi:hypothetical protein
MRGGLNMALPRKPDYADLAGEMLGIVLGGIALLVLQPLILNFRFWLLAIVPLAFLLPSGNWNGSRSSMADEVR